MTWACESKMWTGDRETVKQLHQAFHTCLILHCDHSEDQQTSHGCLLDNYPIVHLPWIYLTHLSQNQCSPWTWFEFWVLVTSEKRQSFLDSVDTLLILNSHWRSAQSSRASSWQLNYILLCWVNHEAKVNWALDKTFNPVSSWTTAINDHNHPIWQHPQEDRVSQFSLFPSP